MPRRAGRPFRLLVFYPEEKFGFEDAGTHRCSRAVRKFGYTAEGFRRMFMYPRRGRA